MQKQPTWGERLTELDEVDSTNNYAIARISEGLADHGWSVRANFQRAGRGQWGNSWEAEQGANILCSLVLQVGDSPLMRQFVLNTTFCAALAGALREIAGLESLYIKWPNDLYIQGKKIGGILIENQIRGSQWTYAILGWGINVNQTQFHGLEKAASIFTITQQKHDVVGLTRWLLNKIQKPLEEFINGSDSGLAHYNTLLGKRNELVHFMWNEQWHSGILQEVMADGRIAISIRGELHLFKHKEIAWHETTW
jgi:BirA family biotin operon repressor/biotin-[acetyl-CoA-carboxylase] ligase